jgi:leader peptidase (prepilin peptidase)/N-methyltransferase
VAGFGAGLPALGLVRPPSAGPGAGARRQRLALAAAIGLVWSLVTLRLAPAHPWALPAYLALAYVGVVLAVIDARTSLLPNRLTRPAFVAVAAALTLASLATGAWPALGRGVAAAAVVGGGFLALALARSGGLGMGDVKLAPTLGLALGWLSWGAVFSGVALAYLLGGVVALGAVVLKRANRHSSIPFGPFLIAGTLLAVLTVGVQT